jgi:hypoxanthine phosphoribosyltransferase
MTVETEKQPPPFSHPAEAEFARILDFYGIAWQYEPRTFPLSWDREGRVTEAFSPDFYLPDQDLYIELTTMQPHLVTKKNRKLRRFRELYPDVHIKLFKRKDIRALMLKYGLEEESQAVLDNNARDKQGRADG